MGLEEFTSSDSSFKRYSLTEDDEILQRHAEEFKELLPDDFKMDFIEASPSMSELKTMSYARRDGDGELHYFIRVGEGITSEDYENTQQRVRLAMIRLHIMQQDKHEDDDMETCIAWLAGKLDVSIDRILLDSQTWKSVCKPFRSVE